MTFRWNCIAAGLRGSASDTRLVVFQAVPSASLPRAMSRPPCAWPMIRTSGLREFSQVVQNACGVMADEDVTFTRLEIGQFHDGVRFANGAQVTLQRLGPGVKGSVIDALLSPLWAPEMAEVL